MERLSLSNTAFEGNNNSYLFADGPETVLVDTGDWTGATREQLEAGLEAHGYQFSDIDRILLTHWHLDHTGLAGEIQAASGASIHVHAADAPLVEGDEEAWSELHDHHTRAFEAWGMPESKQEVLRERLSGPETIGETPDVTPFEHGETFSVNDSELSVVHTPGHAAGLCLFELDDGERTEVLSGDALLPKYTPNVGGADVRVDHALEKYLHALRAIVEADYARAWPGHRQPIDNPTARAREIRQHHEDRTQRVLDALDKRGPSDAWTVSNELFGALDGIHILHGPGEASAHLEHLVADGFVAIDGIEYRLIGE
ncbi:MBL fold metallo-hydrolase [Haloarcula amylovorans]|uniref:MBL fold metallo-hydrolase n=1 Tax=Haloarcula amylovorans TaxID=2562280 RepID=UPI0010764750|nr:MBL fold metallo-hydrolase [Halomicroarcula amylolytica]